ncbi:MAG: hypothetical protein KKG88_10925 [Proteobacteria bacterium]|nr:hypothetical protein [Pseudomonadota bacterium]
MPIVILVTFMDAGPPKARLKFSAPPLSQEPEDKMIVLVVAGGGSFPSFINAQWLRENIKILPDWLFQKKLNIENHGLEVAITWESQLDKQ